MDERRVFLELKEVGPLIDDLESGVGLFVPTRLALPLGSIFVLAVRLQNTTRAVELPMQVVGRRAPRGGSVLAAGVIAKLADPNDAMFELLIEVARGRVVDLEARIQERTRIPAHSRFTTTAEALCELRALLEGPAQMPLDRLVARGDRLALTVYSDEDGKLGVPHVVVRSVGVHDGMRSASVELFDAPGRATVEALLHKVENRLARA